MNVKQLSRRTMEESLVLPLDSWSSVSDSSEAVGPFCCRTAVGLRWTVLGSTAPLSPPFLLYTSLRHSRLFNDILQQKKRRLTHERSSSFVLCEIFSLINSDKRRKGLSETDCYVTVFYTCSTVADYSFKCHPLGLQTWRFCYVTQLNDGPGQAEVAELHILRIIDN